jgi:hypothetical protein
MSSFTVLKVTEATGDDGEEKERLERAGALMLSTDQTSLNNGRCLTHVPCMSGIPRTVTLYGGGNAFIATMGVGVQAATTADAAKRLAQGIPSNPPPGLGLYKESSCLCRLRQWETAFLPVTAGVF